MRPLQAGSSAAAGPGGLYAVVVIVALLFCHGAFGYEHQLSPAMPPADASAAHVAHVEGGHQPDPDGGAAGSHLGGTYFVTLLVLLLGTSLLLGGGVSVSALPAPTPGTGGHKARRLHPPCGPTSSHMQVFRL